MKLSLRRGRSGNRERRGRGRVFRSTMWRRNFWVWRWPANFAATLAGKKILLPRSERARADLPNALTSVGAEVTEVVAYHTGGIGVIEPGVMRRFARPKWT